MPEISRIHGKQKICGRIFALSLDTFQESTRFTGNVLNAAAGFTGIGVKKGLNEMFFSSRVNDDFPAKGGCGSGKEKKGEKEERNKG